MTKTKTDLDRNEKAAEIVAVARRMFLEHGYEASSMGRIAEQAGVAPNTIYWYFADKDALLVTVLNELLVRAMREYEKRKQGPLDGQMLWLLGEFEGARSLIATVHARASVAEAVRTWHENFHRVLEATLLMQLRAHDVAPSDLEPASKLAMFVVEGMLAHPSSTKERRALVRWLVTKLLPSGASSSTT